MQGLLRPRDGNQRSYKVTLLHSIGQKKKKTESLPKFIRERATVMLQSYVATWKE
jgi:hypothetical protein